MAWEYPEFEKSEGMGRLVGALFAVSWAVVPGFGVIDLSVTVQPTDEWLGVVPLNAGWGLLTTVLLGGAFAWAALRPRRFAVATVQIVTVALALTVSAVAGSESGAFVLGAVAGIELLIVGTLLPREHGGAFSIDVSWPLAVTAAIAAGPWFMYAADMWAADREGRAPEEITIGMNQRAIQGALALAVALLSAVVALWAPGRRFIGISIAAVAIYLGVSSYRFPDAAGAYGQTWSVLSVAWGGVTAILVLLPGSAPHERRRERWPT